MNFHEFKDIAMIYSQTNEGKSDYTWDKAQIKVWNPSEQREMDLVFTGSQKGDTPEEHSIHFNVHYKNDEIGVFNAYREALKTIFPNIGDETLVDYEHVFINKLIEQRKLC